MSRVGGAYGTRPELIEALYDAEPSLFPDLRHLDSMPLMLQRVGEVNNLMKRQPPLSVRKRERLRMERVLLKHKLALYLYGSRRQPTRRRLSLLAPYVAVRNTEYSVARRLRHISRRDAQREKRTQTLVLLGAMLLNSTSTQLERAVERFGARVAHVTQ